MPRDTYTDAHTAGEAYAASSIPPRAAHRTHTYPINGARRAGTRAARAVLVCAALLTPRLMHAQPTPPTSEELRVESTGLAARFHAPAHRAGAAVIVLNGSDGGYPPERLGEELARRGHAALRLAYFSGFLSAPIRGLPTRLSEIPLEYIERAIDWLARRTGRPVVLMGESRGAELALLVASRRADVTGVVAFAPSSAVWQAPRFSPREPVGAAWTVGGRAVPYLIDAGDSAASGVERFAQTLAKGTGDAGIPITRVRGRALLIAGGDDRIWPAAQMAESLAALARRAGGPRVEVLRYPDAGHLLMGPGAGRERFVGSGWVVEFGGTAAANRAARDEAWARTLAFLDTLAVHRPASGRARQGTGSARARP
jgi:dienelactone hydrolase